MPEGFTPSRADKALARLLPNWPAFAIRDAFKQRDVKCNGIRISPDTPVRVGDVLSVYAKAPDAGLEIVFEDARYAVVNKRQGMPTQGEGSAEVVFMRQSGGLAFACHRLDVMTGGLLLLAKTEAARAEAEEAFRSHLVRKTYRALVKGCPSPEAAVLRAFLRKDAGAAKVQVYDNPVPGGLPIETRYWVVEAGEITRLEVEIVTGRTHQIRAHLQHIGHPVLGDDKYGDRALNRAYGARRQKLWATRLTLWDGRTFMTTERF